MKINIKRIENGKLPSYETIGSVGADCYARLNEKIIVKAKTVVTIPLGFAVEIPEGYEMQIRGRSGNARKKWVQVFNSPGTIDSDYRGEVGAILYNASEVDFEVNPEDRIAQAVICPIIKAEWNETSELSETGRGTGGFGSTGTNSDFYEPFQTVAEVEKYLGKKVLIDNYTEATLISASYDEKNNIVIKLLTEQGITCFYLTMAFQRVTIEGHRFGKKMELN